MPGYGIIAAKPAMIPASWHNSLPPGGGTANDAIYTTKSMPLWYDSNYEFNREAGNSRRAQGFFEVYTLELMQWLTDTEMGRLTFTILVSMVPVIELRGGIPFGVALGLPTWQAFAAAVVGNMIPIPFIVVYIRRILKWVRRRIPKVGRLIDKLEKKAHLKGRTVSRYKYLGLFVFVAIPLPGTGAWTGALVAAFLDMPLRRAIPSILCGVITAGLIMTFLTHTVTTIVT